MNLYRRNDDTRWWPVRSRPMPVHWPVEVRVRGGAEYSHAIIDGSGEVFVSGHGCVTLTDVLRWRYQLPPNFRLPGDAPGSWMCPEEQFDSGPPENVVAAGDNGTGVAVAGIVATIE